MFKNILYFLNYRILFSLTILILFCHSYSYSEVIFNDKEINKIENIIEEWIINNPKKVRTILTDLEKNEKAEYSKKNMELLSYDSLDPVLGNMNGDVIIYEFFDYNCGYCKSVYDTLMSVIQKDGNVKLVMKELPILSQSSNIAARFALASKKQNSYNEFHGKLMQYRGQLTKDIIIKIAKNLNLDLKKLQIDFSNPIIDKILSNNRILAQRMELSGTPAFIIGSTIVPGAIDKKNLIELIKKARNENL